MALVTRAAHVVVTSIGAVLLTGCGPRGDVDDARGESASERSASASSPVPATENVTPSSATPPVASTVAATDPEPDSVPVDPAVLDGMLLHLPDAPEGGRIGDDSHCGGGLSTEGGSDPFLDLVGESGGAMIGCFNQLEAPTVFINSLVVAFPNDDLATRAISPAAFDGIVRYYGLGCCTDEAPGSVEVTTGLGVVGVQAVSDSDSVAIVGWRSGSLVGAISVLHMDRSAGALTDAQGLLVVQEARMRTPVPVPKDLDDDRLVELEAAPFQTWWLGDSFAPPGLPAMELFATYYRDGMAELDYAGVRVEIFNLAAIPDGSVSAQILGVADDLFDSPCTVIVPLERPDGNAALLGRVVPDEFFGPPSQAQGRIGWGSLDEDDCPEGEPNVWMATVQFGEDLLVRINPPLCYNCLSPPDRERPYNQPDGLRAVVAALTAYAH